MKNIKQALQSAKGKERIEYRAGRNLSAVPVDSPFLRQYPRANS